ncbi:uncharacterized protein LOC111087963 [Limulus polyphemus]|uniref:Uncharacterized protein LOC111087963 n=1 Tax=Limulus polyphemus TaxID=6850 RepID=A0ABM1T8N1_LIMPO|nr:uncharacterized protein LOC111087963 [Limulus polyphemus]
MSPKSARFVTLILLVAVVCTLFTRIRGQQFYPNGRYGRRDSMPPLSGGNREMILSFFGDGSVRCVYTGYSDYYRCGRSVDKTNPQLTD